MRQLTDDAQQALRDIAARHGASEDAARHLLFAVVAGHGTQAQFNHPELGGMGQWSRGGMIMLGDMFNTALKARVDGLCNELAALAGRAGIFQPEPERPHTQSQFQGDSASLTMPDGFGHWWPDGLGHAASTGSQNNLRYAFFPESRRLAIDIGGQVRVYDTRDHRIGGFSQQQSGGQSLSFTSQYGLVDLASLDQVTTTTGKPTEPVDPPMAGPLAVEPSATDAVARGAARDGDIIDKIERLAGLHARGILTDAEFQAKKADLLGRL
ncbi:MAG: SHOCT domain-containing protein [Rhizobium sp.]|nr:SHOCT domain-containing protein [Rhizobium sp.]